jgi:hypothetical protein
MSLIRIAFMVSFFVWLAFELWIDFRDRAKDSPTEDKNSGIYLFFLVVLAISTCIILQYTALPRIPISPDLRFLIGTVIICTGSVLR